MGRGGNTESPRVVNVGDHKTLELLHLSGLPYVALIQRVEVWVALIDGAYADEGIEARNARRVLFLLLACG